MRIALTGVTGFIGRHVLAELEQRGHEAVLLVRPSTALLEGLDRRELHRCDLVSVGADAIAAIARADVLVQLAWGGLPNYRSLHHFEHELPVQYGFLKAVIAAGLRRLVVAGTCFEYGMQAGALDETMAAQPANPYAFAKDALRRQLEYLQGETPFALSWARLFYMYGDGQSRGSLWPLLQAAVARGDAVFPMSGGEQLRDYLPVAEVAARLVDLAEADAGCGIVNVSSGRPVSVRALVEGWIADNGWHIAPKLGHYPYPTHEPMAFWGDNRKLHRCLNLQ